MTTIQLRLQNAVAEGGVGTEGCSVISYSGRGMFGKVCLAIAGPLGDCQKAITAAIDTAHDEVVNMAKDGPEVHEARDAFEDRLSLANEHFYDVVGELVHARHDAFGHDVVLYFPDVPYVQPDDIQESDDDNE